MSTEHRQFETVYLGEELPVLEVPVTAGAIVASSIAARDFHPLHQDPDYARQQGHPHIFLNILASAGYVERYVTDWAGPRSLIRSISTRLGVPHYAGDQLVLRGKVAARAEDDERWVEVVVTGTNSGGQHLQSVVRLELRFIDTGCLTAQGIRQP